MGKTEASVATVSMEEAASRAHVTEIIYADGAVKIKYEIAMESGNGHEANVKCYEAPAPDFAQALERLHRHAAKVMEWEDEILGMWARTVKVVGMGITHKRGRRHARFMLRKKLESGSIAEIKTPWMLIVSSAPQEVQMGEAAQDDIDEMLAQARRFIAGERAQARLFHGEVA